MKGMLFTTIFKVGIKSLIANKLRTILAMLGIIIGVCAVIAMLAIGSGAKKDVMDRFTSMGTNLLIIMPGQRGSHGVVSGLQQNLTLADALAVAKEIKGVSMVAPAVQSSSQIKYFNKNARTTVFGTSPSYFFIRDIEIERGRFFSDGESEKMSHNAVIGPTAAKNIFNENDPINENIKINGINFKIIGICKPKGEGWMSPDDRVIIPYTTAMNQLFGVSYIREIDIKIDNEANLDEAEAEIKKIMRKRHKLQDNQDDDFFISNMAEIRKNASEVVDIFKWLLGGIAAISLLVGGIGIMNIMLVTVTERTREIGIRKAIGANEIHILTQFLIEAVIISGFGGLIGLLLGISSAKIVSKLSPLSTVVELTSTILAISVAISVGIFFGFYPAWRASRLDPIDALRYE